MKFKIHIMTFVAAVGLTAALAGVAGAATAAAATTTAAAPAADQAAISQLEVRFGDNGAGVYHEAGEQ